MKWLLGVEFITRSGYVCHTKGFKLLSGMRAWSCIVYVYFSLLVTVLADRVSTPVSANFSQQDFHPALLLSSSSNSLKSLSSSEDTIRGEEIQEKEVLHRLFRNGQNRNDLRKPSTTFMVSLFNELQRRGITSKDKASTTTDTIRSFSGKSSKNTKKVESVVDFYIPPLPPHEKLRHAEIRFLRNSKNKAKPRKFKFRIDVKKGGKTVRRFVLRARLDPQIRHDVFDVTKIVSPWINSFHGNIIFHVKLSKKFKSHSLSAVKNMSLQSTSLIVFYLEDNDFLTKMYSSFTSGDRTNNREASEKTAFKKKRTLSNSFTPLLNSSSKVQESWDLEINSTTREKRNVQRRQKRNGKNKKWSHKSSHKEMCKIYDFVVDFNVIGWGQWIIHPKKFNARFCSGECPSPIDAQYKPTNHAMLQTLMRMKRPLRAPLPCCVPINLNPISMIYFENNEIVVRHHDDMVASQCGCR